MRFLPLLSVLASFNVCCIDAIPVEDVTAQKVEQRIEERLAAPEPWQWIANVEDGELLHLNIVLRGGPENDLAAKLMEISSPGSPEYRKHMSQQQLKAFTAPSTKTIDSVQSWLESQSGVSNAVYESAREAFSFDVTASTANEMLSAEFASFREPVTGSVVVRSLTYTLPSQVAEHVALVHPVSYFPRVQKKSEKKGDAGPASDISHFDRRVDGNATELLAACQTITPFCIAALYNIDYTPLDSLSGSTLGVAGFLGQYINHTDIHSWVSKYGNSPSTRASPGNFTVELVNGGLNNESYFSTGVEATLDMEYSMPFIGSLPVTYYSTGGRGEVVSPTGTLLPLNESSNEPYLEFLEYLLAKPDGEIPLVLSISYTDTEQTVPRDYALHVCDLFGRLTARGVSIIDASGDGGVAGQDDVSCISNDGLAHPQFLPTFPASCPYVTSVGWSFLVPIEQGNAGSAGGFSNYFPTPTYQLAATSSYIASLNGQYAGLYNASGRGIPDIAMYGSRYETENNNVTSGHHSGTSAGTPVFASMIALVNDIRLRDGKPALGWLNPLLYSEALQGVFNDITEGVSYGCGESWNATVGWDAVTGLGSVDFRRLLDILG